MALLFNDERAIKAVLPFLRKAKVGQMAIIPPRDGEEGEGEVGESGEMEEVKGS